MQRLNITLPNDLANDLRQAIPTRSRSKFIAEALKDKLTQKKNLKADFIKSLKANKKLYNQVAKEWAATEVEGWPD